MAYEYAIALTGSIATGKSTVASLLALNGMRIIDADTISHEILDASASWVEETFGSEYLRLGRVDRPKLGNFVFSDDDAKRVLEEFLHPKIRAEIKKRSEKQDRLKFPYLIDIPLFFENNSYSIPIQEKKERATWVIDNSKNLKHLQKECEDFVEIIKKKYLK